MSNWISVKERLPKLDEYVLIYYADSCFVNIGFLDSDFMEWNGLDCMQTIRPDYWMPLPEPPKDDVEGV